jgi:hypothetical protein
MIGLYRLGISCCWWLHNYKRVWKAFEKAYHTIFNRFLLWLWLARNNRIETKDDLSPSPPPHISPVIMIQSCPLFYWVCFENLYHLFDSELFSQLLVVVVVAGLIGLNGPINFYSAILHVIWASTQTHPALCRVFWSVQYFWYFFYQSQISFSNQLMVVSFFFSNRPSRMETTESKETWKNQPFDVE